MTTAEFLRGMVLERRSQAHRRRAGLAPSHKEWVRRGWVLMAIEAHWAACDGEAAAGREVGEREAEP